MTIASLFILSAGCILIAMAIESLLKSTGILNLAAALLLSVAAVLAGSMGLKEIFLMGNSRFLTLAMLHIQNSAIVFIGFSLFFFSMNFPKEKKTDSAQKYLPWVMIAGIVCMAVVLVGWNITKYDYIIIEEQIPGKVVDLKLEYNLLHYVILSLSLLSAIYSLLNIVLKYRKMHLIYQKKQIRYFITGIIFFIVVFGGSVILEKLLPLPVIYFIKSIAFITAGASLLYSVISYRFVNLRKRFIVLIRELIIDLVIAAVPTSLAFIIKDWLASLPVYFYFLILPPALILIFQLYSLSRNLIKKMLRMDYTQKDITESFLDRIGPSRNIEELAKHVIDTITENINCGNADFLLFDKEKDLFKVVSSANNRNYTVSAIDPFFRRITPDMGIYDREIINFDPRFSNIRDNAERYFKRHETALILPVFYENTVTGLIHISNKLDNNTYTSTELILLTKLKKITQIVLNNLILFEKEQEAKVTKRDLNLASDIQESVFQKVIPEFLNMDVHGYMKPAKEVSGDYFLIDKVNNNAFGVLVADVSGKGFSAALISMVIHTIARSQEFSSSTVNAIVAKINEVLTSNQGYGYITKTMSFATVFCGYIDNSIKTLFYTNAGHYPMIVYHQKNKTFDYIKANSKPAGIFSEENYTTGTFHFNQDSIFVLYSDGITEAINSLEEEFGPERLQNIIIAHQDKSSREITEIIIQEVDAFTGDREQFDDITLIVIKL